MANRPRLVKGRFTRAITSRMRALELPPEVEHDLEDISTGRRRYLRAILAHSRCLAALADELQVSPSLLYEIRQHAIELLGPTSPLSKMLYPRAARGLEICAEQRCDRCGLHGHLQGDCDLPTIDQLASSRYDR
jgi:hypothetical protein